MFRYLAIASEPDRPQHQAMARHLAERWRGQPGWRQALSTPWLQVFVTGERPGINEAYPVRGTANDAGPAIDGVVLGRLFRGGTFQRSGHECTDHEGLELSLAEQRRIASSRGNALIDDFWGRYVAFLSAVDGSPCVLRDPSGALPCFRLERGGVSLIFSWLEDALALLPDGPDGQHVAAQGAKSPPQVNWPAIIALARHGALTGRETALDGVSEILAGERMDLSSGRVEPIWSAVTMARQPLRLSDEEAAEALAVTVRACVQAWAGCHDRLLLRLSGGVDSSILLSTLSPEDTSAGVVAVNYHSPGSDSDERPYARAVAASARRPLIEFARDESFRIERALSAARMPSPFPYIGWMNAQTDAGLAQLHGATAMFSGTAGDSLFYEFCRWWPAADYLRSRGLDAGFLSAIVDAAKLGRVSVWRAASLAIKERVHPNLEDRAPASTNDLLAPGAQTTPFDVNRFAHPSWAATAELPLGKCMQTQALFYPIGYYDPFEREAAPELVNPLLSQPLIELCLRLPTYQLTAGGRGRALARRAFANVLPRQVARRRSKGGMEAHVTSVLDANRDLVRELLLDGQLCRRGLVDRAQLEERLSAGPTTLPGRVTQLHSLVAIEAWLTRWPH